MEAIGERCADLGSLVSSCLGAMSLAAQSESEVDFLD